VSRFLIPAPGYSLKLAAGFGFGPRIGASNPVEALMRLAFCADGYASSAGVLLSQDAQGTIAAEVQGGADISALKRQVERILSLDHDPGGWAEVGKRDSVMGRLQTEFAGFRPVLFHSPYEAAAWGVIAGHRPQRQSAAVRQRLCQELGEGFVLGGERLSAFPLPRRLLDAPQLPLPEPAAARLRAVADAALAGDLDAGRLHTLGPEEARRMVLRLPGVGDFYSRLIVIRATGFADALVTGEPLTLRCAAHYYGLPEVPSEGEFEALAERWRPYRTWAVVLLRYAGHRAGVV
jgi:DNA-3-methyladenine glycosylase II